MEWKYGKYKWDWIREKPTQKKLESFELYDISTNIL